MADIVMPQLGETVTEGTITKWLVKVGDTVEIDQPLFEVSTDKVDSEVPSTASGVVIELVANEGDTVEVGKVVARLGGADEVAAPAPPTAAPAPPPQAAVAPPQAPVEAPAPPAPAPPPQAPVAPAVQAPAVQAPAAQAPAVQAPAAQAPSGPAPAQEPPVSVPAAPLGVGETPVAAEPKFPDLVLSPVVRHLIEENGLDPYSIQGTGVGGRITRADVLAVLDQRASRGRVESPSAPPAPPAAPAAQVPTPPARMEQGVAPVERPIAIEASELSPGSRDYVVPFTNIRRRTAEHMVRSKAVSAHTLMSIEVDFERIERVRRQRQEEFKAEEGFSLTYLPFIVRATVEAIKAYPNVNASVVGDSLVVHRDINMSIAVDLNLEGLIAPVIHGADGKRLAGIAREIHDLATRARTRRLSADEIQGGTFTITNPGPFGTFMTGAIINQPQVAILATDGIRRKPVVLTDQDGNESIGIHSVGMLTINFDHRAIDGAYAAAFLAKERQVIESWNWEQEL